MALTITHSKTNNVTDWTQADLDAQIALGNFAPGTLLADITLPSDWNANHALSGSIAWGEITGTLSSQTDLQTALNGKQASGNYITALTGDVTASGPGSVSATLATVNANTGSFGSATQVATFTVNGKGLITAAGNTSISIPASALSATSDGVFFGRTNGVGPGAGQELTITSFGEGWLQQADDIAGRSFLGLGSMAIQDASSVSISGGSVDVTSSTVNGVNLTTAGSATQYLDGTGNYSTPAGGSGLTRGQAYMQGFGAVM